MSPAKDNMVRGPLLFSANFTQNLTFFSASRLRFIPMDPVAVVMCCFK